MSPVPDNTFELRILHRKGIYPYLSGANLRTMNLARLSRGVFERTAVFSMDNCIDYESDIDGIHVIQEKELLNVKDKLRYYIRAIAARELIIPYSERAFDRSENTLFQIEDPLLFPLLKKKNISRFILDETDVNWEMYGIPQPSIKKQIYSKIGFRRDKNNEKQALKNAAQVICCSSRDREILVNEVSDITDKISVIPNCVNFQEYDSACQSTIQKQDRQIAHILFIGTLSHPPNIEAVRLICQIIAPHSPSSYQFTVVGKNPPAFHHSDNIQFSGYVDDVKPVMADADICIAPIRSGSGTRLKILEYMAMGKPVIATSKAAEGIEYTDGLNIIIEDKIDKYPEIIRQLLDDEGKCLALGREARDLIQNKYDWKLYRKSLEKIYRDAVG